MDWKESILVENIFLPYKLMSCAGQAGIKGSDTSPNELFPCRVEGVGSTDIVFSDFTQDNIDSGVMELRCHKEFHPFNLTILHLITVNQDSPGRFNYSYTTAAAAQINFS